MTSLGPQLPIWHTDWQQRYYELLLNGCFFAAGDLLVASDQMTPAELSYFHDSKVGLEKLGSDNRWTGQMQSVLIFSDLPKIKPAFLVLDIHKNPKDMEAFYKALHLESREVLKLTVMWAERKFKKLAI